MIIYLEYDHENGEQEINSASPDQIIANAIPRNTIAKFFIGKMDFIGLHPGIFQFKIRRVELLVRVELSDIRKCVGIAGKTFSEKLLSVVEIMEDELTVVEQSQF